MIDPHAHRWLLHDVQKLVEGCNDIGAWRVTNFERRGAYLLESAGA